MGYSTKSSDYSFREAGYAPYAPPKTKQSEEDKLRDRLQLIANCFVGVDYNSLSLREQATVNQLICARFLTRETVTVIRAV